MIEQIEAFGRWLFLVQALFLAPFVGCTAALSWRLRQKLKKRLTDVDHPSHAWTISAVTMHALAMTAMALYLAGDAMVDVLSNFPAFWRPALGWLLVVVVVPFVLFPSISIVDGNRRIVCVMIAIGAIIAAISVVMAIAVGIHIWIQLSVPIDAPPFDVGIGEPAALLADDPQAVT